MQPVTGNAPSAPVDETRLRQLCTGHGVGTTFAGWDGAPHEVDPNTLIKVLAALGVPAHTNALIDEALVEAELAPWRRMLPPTVVRVEGTETLVPVHVPHGADVRLWVVTEDGRERALSQRDIWVEPRPVAGRLTGRATFEVPQDLPLGWHTLHADAGEEQAQSTLIVVPARLETAEQLEPRRGWGLAAQLYSARSRRSWGIGDFADLADLAALSATRGADYILVNPLHAAEPSPPVQPSPYSPSTRRFFHPLYIRIEDVPELAYLPVRQREVVDRAGQRSRRLNRDANRLNRDRSYAAKLEALELVYHVKRSTARERAFQAFRRGHGAGLEDFALWCALRENAAADDPLWQDPAMGPASPFAEKQRRKLARRIDFHCWLQWICDEQLESAQRAAKNSGMRLGVVHDLAVGADLNSAGAWTLRGTLAPGISVGAPPDMYNQLGQNWSQPPWHPHRLAEAGYAPFRDMLRTVLRHAGGVRVDHILGLFRLWWVPEGNSPVEGTYVGYDHEALIGILVLEAQRAGAVVIGEDLGTFEPWVQDYLAKRGILGTSILWFENDDGAPLPPEEYRRQCLASVNTHDLPPTAGYLAGEHVALRDRLGLLEGSLAEEQARHRESLDAVLELVRARGMLPADGKADEVQIIEALHRFLAQSPSVLLGVALTDGVGERRVQNQPGTGDEYPNWQVPLADAAGNAVLIEDLQNDARFNSLLAAVESALRGSTPSRHGRR